MKGIPAELDRLMWLVAEQDNSAAIEEFGERYPLLRAEFAKRLELVRGLRGAKVTAGTPIPDFRPRSISSPPIWRPLGLAAAACLAVLAIGFAGYRELNPTSPTAHFADSTGAVVRTSGAASDGAHLPHQMEPLLDEPDGMREPEIPADSEGPSTKPEPKFTLKLRSESVEDALHTIATEAKVRFTIAPGLEKAPVVTEFQNSTLGEILGLLGVDFGFTALEQEEGHYLVIPARDANPSR